MLDLTDMITPKSDQINADDLITGPRTFTVKGVRRGNSDEQPLDIILEEFPASRPYKPGKSMRRVLAIAWGKDAETFVGKRLTLYTDPTVKFGGQDTGGIRISHLSHIDGQKKIALTVTRGKKAPFVVKPLAADAPVAVPVSEGTLAELYAMFERKGVAEEAQLAGVNRVIGGNATAIETITEQEAARVIAALATRPDVKAGE